MTQQPAYTTTDVIAAGIAMRARGTEPDRAGLWNELGRRGLSKTAWNAWLEHRDQQLPLRPGIDLDGETHSPELTAAIESQNRTLTTVIACARAEAEAPLRRRIEMLEKMLAREGAERQNIERLVNDLETELAERDATIAGLQTSSGHPRLILPGRH